MSPGAVRAVCIALAVAIFVADLLTPQLLVVAILLDGAIALSSLALDARFTRALTLSALVADVVAGYANGVADGGHWSTIAVIDRCIAAFSFVLVGAMTIAAQRSNKAAGEFAARAARAERERGVRRAVEAIRGSMNEALIRRATVREACAALGADVAIGLFRESNGTATLGLRALSGSNDLLEHGGRPSPQLASLFERVVQSREPTRVVPDDALGRFLLDDLERKYAYAAPVIEHETGFGLLLLARDTPFDAAFEDGVRAYVEQAAIALAQARLFVQLADNNAKLAQANDALRDRGAVIRDIVYALSHDLRTPLAAARMTMVQALDGAYGTLPPEYRKIVKLTLASNDRLQGLAETLLLVSRYESGEASSRKEPVDLALIAGDAVAELSSLMAEKHLGVRLDLPPCESATQDVVVLADPGELHRAVTNLVANAIAATPDGGTLELRVRRASSDVLVEVEDSGPGIAPERAGRLFERFAAAGPGAGTGLGLYIVRRIAENAGGRVTYTPRTPGGSRFTLTLPAHAAEPLPA